jgi:hypothetical protein
MKSLPAGVWSRTPVRELAILRMPLTQFYGEKIVYTVAGLLIPPVLSAFFALIGLALPAVIPAFGTLALAVVMFFLPDYNVREDAKKAKVEFARALGA